jgi:hypothetical protein
MSVSTSPPRLDGVEPTYSEPVGFEDDSDPMRRWGALVRRLESLLATLTCSREQIGQIAWHVKSRRYSPGQTIVRRGERDPWWGLVVRGEVAVLPASPGPRLRRAPRAAASSQLLPGNSFGERMLIEGVASPHTLRAMSDVEVYALRRADLIGVLGNGRLLPGAGKRLSRWTVVAGLGLLAVALAIAGYLGATFAPSLSQSGQRGPGPERAPAIGGTVQLMAPAAGQVYQRSGPVKVRALVTGADVVRAQLLVDGVAITSVGQPTEGRSPWVAELNWVAEGEGTHALVVQADASDGSKLTSMPIPVVVVPGGRLYFSSNRDGPQAIYSMRTDGSDVRLFTVGPGDCTHPTLSRLGDLAFVCEDGRGLPVIRWLPGGRGIPVELVAGRDPALSLQGDRLGYVASVDQVGQIFAVAVPSGEPRQISNEAVYAGQPAWSSDGTRLAYVVESEHNLDIWVMDLEGGGPQRLTDDPGMDWAPAWAPDGTELAFVSNRSGVHQIYLMHSDGTLVQQVTALPQGAEAPNWSPTGHWLAFVGYTGDGAGVNSREVYVMRVDGSDMARLTWNAADDTHPVWTSTPQ